MMKHMQKIKAFTKQILLVSLFVMGGVLLTVDSNPVLATSPSLEKKSADKVDIKATTFKKRSEAADPSDKAAIFVEKVANQAITSLSKRNIGSSQRHRRFKNILNQSFDMKFISRFTMGRYWRQMNKKQRKTYQRLLTDLLAKNYASLFENYAGEQVNIIGSSFDPQNKQTIVRGQLIKKNGQVVSLKWRLHETNKKFKMLDVIVEGISMLTTQREEMISVVQNHGNNIDKLLSFLKSRI